MDSLCIELFDILFIRAHSQGWGYLAFSSPSAPQPCFLLFQTNRVFCSKGSYGLRLKTSSPLR